MMSYNHSKSQTEKIDNMYLKMLRYDEIKLRVKIKGAACCRVCDAQKE